MKNFYLLVLTLVAATAANAQTLTQANNAPAVGDTYTVQQCDSLNISPGGAGANSTWNFSSLVIHNNLAAINYSVYATTNTVYPTNTTSAGVVAASSPSDQAYFVPSATALKYYGGNITVQSYAATLIYTSPAIYAVYPMSLNTSSSSATAGSISIVSPPLSGTFTGSSNTIADGTGVLMLPGGTAGTFSNVLRVVNTQTLNYNATVTGVVTLANYNYYQPGLKFPLLTISTTTITTSFPASTNVQTVVTIYKDYLNPVNGIGESKIAMTELSVYPNPAVSQLNFVASNKAAKEALIYDVTGKLIEKQNFNEGKLKLDVSNYNSGLYLYTVLNNGGEILKTGKVTVNH